MAIDIGEKISEIVEKINGDNSFAADFKKNPVEAIEKLLGVDLPDEKIKLIVDGVKAKLDGVDLSSAVDGIKDKLSGLFGKK